MPTTISYYEQFLTNLGSGNINLISDDFRVLLVNNYTYDAADDELDDVFANEIVEQYGYLQGGKLLTNQTFGWVPPSNKFDADDVEWVATGGTIGPATGAVIYSDTSTSNKLVAYIDFGTSHSIPDTDRLKLTINTGGLFTLAVQGV